MGERPDSTSPIKTLTARLPQLQVPRGNRQGRTPGPPAHCHVPPPGAGEDPRAGVTEDAGEQHGAAGSRPLTAAGIGRGLGLPPQAQPPAPTGTPWPPGASSADEHPSCGDRVLGTGSRRAVPTSRGCWSLWPQLPYLYNGHVDGFHPAGLRRVRVLWMGSCCLNHKGPCMRRYRRWVRAPRPSPTAPRNPPSLSPPWGCRRPRAGPGGAAHGQCVGAACLAGLVGGCRVHSCLLGLVMNQTR